MRRTRKVKLPVVEEIDRKNMGRRSFQTNLPKVEPTLRWLPQRKRERSHCHPHVSFATVPLDSWLPREEQPRCSTSSQDRFIPSQLYSQGYDYLEEIHNIESVWNKYRSQEIVWPEYLEEKRSYTVPRLIIYASIKFLILCSLWCLRWHRSPLIKHKLSATKGKWKRQSLSRLERINGFVRLWSANCI